MHATGRTDDSKKAPCPSSPSPLPCPSRFGAQDSAATPEIEPIGKAPSEAIVGYWAPNPESALAMMMSELPAEAKQNEAALALMKATMGQMLSKMAFRFAGGETEMVSVGGIESATWKAVSEDAKTGKLVVTITKPDGSSEDGVAIVGKDKLLLINPGEQQKIALDRISEGEFEKRKAAAAAAGSDAPYVPPRRRLVVR